MSSKNLRQLLPAAQTHDTVLQPSPSSSKYAAPKRHITHVACETCRRRKIKCDGTRPTCGACSVSKVACTFAVSESEASQAVIQKKRYGLLKGENKQMRELFNLLRLLPETDARETLSRIRAADNPISALQYARGIRVPSATAQTTLLSGEFKPRLRAIECAALADSLIQVPARPWTVVAGDGIVSELITSFFLWDDAFFYPFIHRDAFINDMRAATAVDAKYCSPFLVNAICALRCFTSRTAKAYSVVQGTDLATAFLNEAKKLLDLENGRASIPTTQGLALMFTLSAYRGIDRAGMMYRYSACEMLKRLSLEKMFLQIWPDPSKEQQKQVLAKAIWGFFCFESIVAFVYLQQSLIQPPKIARYFGAEFCCSVPFETNLDVLGEPHCSKSRSPPFVPTTLDATCDLSTMLFDVMALNAEPQETIGSDEDLSQRKELYDRLQQWRRSLSNQLRNEFNFTPQTCFLRVYFSEVVIAILRPLPPDLVFRPSSTIKDLCIRLAIVDIAVIKAYVQSFSLLDYSCMVLCGIHNGLLTLVSHLHDSKTHEPFVAACIIMHATSEDFPMARLILQGNKALCWTLSKLIPPAALPYLEFNAEAKESLRDIPLAFALPQVGAVRGLLFDEDADTQNLGTEMGMLLSKWSALSTD